MKRKLSLMAAVLICSVMSTTCDLFKEMVKAPELSLKSVDFTEIDFTGLTLLSKVDVRNDNSIDIPLPKIDWDLNVIENPFVKGVIESNGALKSRGSTEVEFPVSFTYVDLIKTIVALTDENAKYKINMMAHIPVPQLGDMSWPFSHEGKIPLMRAPDINFETPPKASLTYGLIPGIPNGGKVEFALNLKNKSNVAVVINDLSCILKIGSFTLPRGGVDGNPRINAGETGKIPFSFNLSAADIVSIGASLLTGSSISDFDLNGNYKFGIPEFPLLNEIGDTFNLRK